MPEDAAIFSHEFTANAMYLINYWICWFVRYSHIAVPHVHI